MELVQSVRRAARVAPDKVAVIYGERRTTWAGFAARVEALAGALAAKGVTIGSRVAILSENNDRYMEALFALFGLGAVAVPLNTRLSVEELRYQLADSGAVGLFHDATHAGSATAIWTGDQGLLIDFETRHEALIAEGHPVIWPVLDDATLAGIFYTGGTTGLPKGVMLSHRNLHAMACNVVMYLSLDEHCVVLHSAPMFHLADFAIFVVTLVAGTHVIASPLTDDVMLQLIERDGVTHAFTVPVVIDRLARSPKLADHDLSSLKVLGYGGAPMPWGTFEHARATFADIDFVQGFGMTEMPAISFLGAEHHRTGADPARLRSAGQAGYGYELRVVDRNGDDAPPGTIGEIVGRGDNVMQGYWNQPEATAAALRDGWMHSGDAGYMDGEGFIYITDRFKDMIVTGAENVYSVEVENALSRHPAVAECAVIGLPDATWGERVHAVIVAMPGEAPTLEGLRDFAATAIARYKLPKSIELRPSPLPRSAAGKVLKRQLRVEAAQESEDA